MTCREHVHKKKTNRFSRLCAVLISHENTLILLFFITLTVSDVILTTLYCKVFHLFQILNLMTELLREGYWLPVGNTPVGEYTIT